MANNDYMEFGFGSGDDSLGGGKFERFKGKEGEFYRMSFVWWPKKDGKPNLDGSPSFCGAKRLYIPNVGYILDKGPEYTKIAGGPSKPTIATVICLWPVDRKGQLDKARFANGEVQVMPWVFSKDKYDNLARRHDEFPFGQYDLNVACTDTQFQKMDMTPARESLLRKVVENDKLSHIAKAIFDKVDQIVGANEKGEPVGLRDIVARNVPIEKVREKLGQSGGASFGADTTAAVDDILDDLVES